MPYPNEHACRLVDPDEVEVVGSEEREHDGKRYRVIYGKPKGGGGSVEQAYRYPLDEGWTESQAQAHCRAHEGILFEPATREASSPGIELQFWAAVHSIETGAEEHLATFYLMNTSLNRNRWRVTEKALEDALPGLIGKALNCIPGYRVNHVHEPLQVGRWIKVEKPDGYAMATAEITDHEAWERLNSGEWGPVSVVILAYRVTCSACGADITGAPDEHVQSGEGHEVVESFRFERVDFVSEPAYPQAGLLTIGHLASWGGPNILHASRSKKDGPQGAQGIDPNPEEKEEKKRVESEIEQLRAEMETLRAENKRLKEESTEISQLKQENQEIREKLERIEAERHQEIVDRAVDARLKAGLAKDRETETQRLKELDEPVLVLLAEDAEKVAERTARAQPPSPKAKYTQDDKSAFEAAVEDTRERLFGHRREA